MKQAFMLLFTTIATIFRAPDEGGTTGGEAQEKTAQEIAAENADLSQRCADAGIEVPAYPATPAGLEQARTFMRDALKKKEEGDAAPKDPADLSGDELRELAEEEDADFSETDTDEEIRAAIVENRAAKAATGDGGE